MRLDVLRWAFVACSTVCLVLSSGEPSLAFDGCSRVTFHLTRSPGNQLLLLTTAPTGTTAQFQDSPALSMAGGNPWQEIGEWEGSLPAGDCFLFELGDLELWAGLRNSDDQGTKFDIRAEVSANGHVVGEADALCLSGLTRNPTQAAKVTLSLPPASGEDTQVIGLKILARIGTPDTPTGRCPGHASATGLRLYFGSANRDSQFAAVFGHGCFAAGTKVVMADGSLRPSVLAVGER